MNPRDQGIFWAEAENFQQGIKDARIYYSAACGTSVKDKSRWALVILGSTLRSVNRLLEQ